MEKVIKIVMNDDKSITIFLNGSLMKTIDNKDRSLSAQEVYEILDYKAGDKYNVESLNEKNIDQPVLTYFKELFEDICKRVNGLSEIKV
jgi:predicted HTH transcriptional regulator